MKKNKKVWNIVSNILTKMLIAFLVLIIIFLLFYVITNTIAKQKGTTPLVGLYTIVSPSMEPYIKKYDVIIDFKVKQESDLKVGDIITFYSDSIDTNGYTVTHRINKILELEGKKYYITKGDNNQSVDDGVIPFENIVGKMYVKIPQFGRIQFLVSSKFGWIVIILIPALGIIIMDSFKLFKIVKIKNDEEGLPKLKKIEKIREKEENNRSKELIKKAKKLNRKVDKNEKK